MKFLEATSRHTDNSIFACQNEEFLLKCQLAQRNEYSHAKRVGRLRSVVTLIFAIFSIIASGLDFDTLSAISSLFAVGLIVFNKYSDGYISSHKKHAASIQQYIDVTLVASAIEGTKSEWGELPNKTDLAKAVSEFSGADTSNMRNWYSDYSSLPGEIQVFHFHLEDPSFRFQQDQLDPDNRDDDGYRAKEPPCLSKSDKQEKENKFRRGVAGDFLLHIELYRRYLWIL